MPHESHSEQDIVQYETAVDAITREASDRHYIDYWNVVNRYYDSIGHEEEASAARTNFHNVRKLERRIKDPQETFLGRVRIDAEDIPEQWYRSLGSLNPMNRTRSVLMLGFVRLWESASGKKFSSDVTDSYNKSIIEISKGQGDTRPSEMMRNIAHDPARAKRAILAGNALLDYVRADPAAERKEGHLYFLDKARQLNEGILDAIKEKDPSEEDKRTASDALKFKHEAIFDILVTKWQTGMITDEQYIKAFKFATYDHITETLELAKGDSSYLNDGDLNEHYLMALLRYRTIWREDWSSVVQAATRREDEPADGFATRNLPSTAFDAKIVDITGQNPTSFIQLKMPDAKNGKYESGIHVIDDLVEEDTPRKMRGDLLDGLVQSRGLLHDLLTDTYYDGGDDVARNVLNIESELGLSVV